MSTPILGAAMVDASQATAMARAHGAEEWFADELPEIYWRICPELGVRPEVTYAQACHGAAVAAEAGLLAGTATTVERLSGKWAPSSTYHTKIVALIEEMLMARKGFVIHHNGPAANCVGQSHARCLRFWAVVCKYHARKFGSKWSDSVYSFGICPHGVRFTGRGWNRSQAANGSDQVGQDDGTDAQWYTVMVFLGADEQPTPAMIDATRDLIAEGRSSGRCGTRVLPHNAFKRKACPGAEFTALARQWDNAPLTPTPTLEDNDMWAGEIIASYGEAGYFDERLGAEKIRQHWRDVRAWIHVVYGKAVHERDGAVASIRKQLGLT